MIKFPKNVRKTAKDIIDQFEKENAAAEPYDIIVVGAGPAGLAAAAKAAECGLSRILIVERSTELGGILNQCIHNGFGLTYFKEELTGPEYAARFIELVESCNVEARQRAPIEIRTDTMVLDITPDKEVHMVSPQLGYRMERAKSIILAMGCRERPRGALSIPGTRPSGVYTAGAAQKYVNIDGYLPGRRVVILGSGDIGLIMARRLTLEGAKVLACVEINDYSSGLNRNIVQCLQDFDIPLLLGHTVTNILGDRRVEGVTVQKVDENKAPIPGTEIHYDCDTLLLSVGLIPENELSRDAGITLDPRTKGPLVFENMETSMPGVFACGNVLHVHDLVDFVTQEAQRAAQAAADYVLNGAKPRAKIADVAVAGGITYTVPQHIALGGAAAQQPGDPATQQPGDPATQQPSDSAAQQPGDPAAQQPGDPAAQQPGDPATQQPIRIFFRVARIFGKSEITVDNAGARIASFTKPFMLPGEMQNIELTPEMLDKISGDITISAIEL